MPYKFRPKTCEACLNSFIPRGARQRKCDNCRPVTITNLPVVGRTNHSVVEKKNDRIRECATCGAEFELSGGRGRPPKNCEECRKLPPEPKPEPVVRKEYVKKENLCEWCGETFVLSGPGKPPRFCDKCRDDESLNKCATCGRPVSGRAKWGATWGGQCDRAEERADRLMRALSGLSAR